MSGPWIAAFATLVVVVLVQGVYLIGLGSETTRTLLRIKQLLGNISLEEMFQGLPVGASLPPFTATHKQGPPLPPEHSPRLLLFLGGDCPPCDALLGELHGTSLELDGLLRL